MKKNLVPILLLIIFVLLGFIFYLLNDNTSSSINSFEDCAAVYPVMESYPAQCVTPDGKHFTQDITKPTDSIPPDIGQGIACTMEAKLCPDGSYVGRTGPSCDFAPCLPGK